MLVFFIAQIPSYGKIGFHSNIQVELRWSKTEIEVLDTKVKVVEGKVITELYTKETDKHLYVQDKTSHPTNIKKAIPYGLGLRSERSVVNEELCKTQEGA